MSRATPPRISLSPSAQRVLAEVAAVFDVELVAAGLTRSPARGSSLNTEQACLPGTSS